jgi:hypothetical protein
VVRGPKASGTGIQKPGMAENPLAMMASLVAVAFWGFPASIILPVPVHPHVQSHEALLLRD